MFNKVQVLTTTLSTKTKRLLAQIGSVIGEGLVEQDNVTVWQWFGFAARPSKATPGKDAAELLTIRMGADDVAIAGQDVRGLEIYGSLSEGETCIYATGEDGTGQARSLYKKNGSVTHYTRMGNTASGAGMMMQLDAATGGINLVDAHGNGLVSGPDGWKMMTAGAASGLVLGSDGKVKLIGTGQAQVDGSSVVLGSVAVPVVNGALAGPTGIAGVSSAKVFIQVA